MIFQNINLKKLWFICSIAFLFTSCKFTEPTIGKFDLKSFSPKSDTQYLIEVTVDVDNPNNYNIWLKGGKFDIMMGNEKMGVIKSKGVVSLKKNKRDTYTIKGIATLNPGSSLMTLIMNGGSNKKVKIKGSLRGGVFIIGKKFDVEFEDKLPSMDMFN
jgi:LEA14-like dessication related protein